MHKNNNNSKYASDVEVGTHMSTDNPISEAVLRQAKKTHSSGKNILQEIHKSIYLFTIDKKPDDSPLRIKKLCDRTQYAVLPSENDGAIFIKLTFRQLKNLCANSPGSFKFSPENLAHLVFYYHQSFIAELFSMSLAEHGLYIEEILDNNMLIISNNKYNYPFNLGQIAASVIWQGLDIKESIAEFSTWVNTRFELFEHLFACLSQEFSQYLFELKGGRMSFSLDGLTKPFDYASLCDDIIFAGYEHRMAEYIKHFYLEDLDCSNSYPSVCARSLTHLLARPQSMCVTKNGYAICAVSDCMGAQTPTDAQNQRTPNSFSLWQLRAQRYVPRHVYNTRVIKIIKNDDFVVSLIGEQISSLALFPKLVTGILSELNLHQVSKVNLIAHNEDVLTISSPGASWHLVNENNAKAQTLFKMVCFDGADNLSMFEPMILPIHGVGTFNIKTVPKAFFDLVQTATLKKNSLPPGHEHYLLGLAYECLHEWGMAIEQFQKALRRDANDAEILHALGSALMENGQVKEGYPFLKKAFARLPENAEVANNLGLSSLELGQLPDAISAFERAVKLNPASADYLTNLGEGYLAALRPIDALEILNKAIRCNPNFAHAHQTLAHLHINSGNLDLAKKHAMLAYKENPIDKNIANLLWQLSAGQKK